MAKQGPLPEGSTSLAATLHLAKAGDARAFEDLVVMYERQVLRVAVRITEHLEDAQDVAQEVFLRLHRKLGSLEAAHVGPWLIRVTVNLCHDLGRRKKSSRLVAMDEVTARGPASSPNPEAVFQAQEMEAKLRTGLAVLGVRERSAIVLRELEGLSTAEVAEALGTSEATVRSQISLARLKLRRFWERSGRRQA